MTASELPGGTVTFLFTDIEGGAQRGGERERLRSIVERHDGSSVAASGRGFLAVFRSAAAAVTAAAEAERVLGSDLAGLGLHRGEDEADAAMRLAASIAAAAQRREVLLSEATARLVAGALPARARLRDVGERGLTGGERRERLFA
jgi:class 3 adenylate cyclase